MASPTLLASGDMLIFAKGFPDPFAVATINGEQTKTTGVIKKTLNPYWNESFDMCVELWAAARQTHIAC